MKHEEYLSIIEEKTALLQQEDQLFWDLWCLNYVIEKISDKKHPHYTQIKDCYLQLWDYNDGKITDLDTLFKIESVEFILNFEDEAFDALDEFDLEERAIQEMVIGLESILINLEEESKVVYDASQQPINVIDIEIEGILISKANHDPIYLNEVKSQFKLLDDLANHKRNYSYEDRNIFRKK
jgi:hypothetical protein